MKIAKPYAKAFNSLFNGNVVSYNVQHKRVAIGTDAVMVSQKEMDDILLCRDDINQSFTLAVCAYIKNV